MIGGIGKLGTQTPQFPSCYPKDFAKKILPQGLPDIELDVFRVCTNGIINRESFYSTFMEITFGGKPAPYGWEKRQYEPGIYSVSCNDTEDGVRHPLKCLVKHHPKAIVAHGKASSIFGPLQRTVDRAPDYPDQSHIDWWLYEGADPSSLFSQGEVSIGE